MTLVVLIIGAIIVIAALRNSQGALASALYQDVPGFLVWAAAILAVGAIGFVPRLKPVSRALMVLVLTVLVLRNYKGILGGFNSAWTHPPAVSTGASSSGGGGFMGGNSTLFGGWNPGQGTATGQGGTSNYQANILQNFNGGMFPGMSSGIGASSSSMGGISPSEVMNMWSAAGTGVP